MEVITNLEYRKYEENNYDFVDGTGKRQSGVSKIYTFLTPDEKIIKIGLAKDCDIIVTMVKGQCYDVRLKINLKATVDKSGVASEKQFYAFFQLVEVIPFKSNSKPEVK